MLRHKCISTTLLYIQDVPELNRHAQRRLEILTGFSDLGAEGLKTLRPWSEDLESVFGAQVGNASKTPQFSEAFEAEFKELVLAVLRTFMDGKA